MDDISVATDIALCRKCGKANSFSALCNAPTFATILEKPPPKGIKVERDTTTNGITLTCPHQASVLLRLFSVMIPVANLCLAVILYWAEPQKGSLGLAIMLVIVSLGISWWPLLLHYGKWVIHLNEGQGTIFYGIGKLGRKRKFSYNQTSSIKVQLVNTKPCATHICISTHYTMFPLIIDLGMKEDVAQFIAATLDREIHR